MKRAISEQIIAQLKEVLNDATNSIKLYKTENFHQSAVYSLTRIYSIVERVAGKSSVYYQRISAHESKEFHLINTMEEAAQILKALIADIEYGGLLTLPELVHGELFSDFLDMSRHLLADGFKDAAAVIAGSSLEAHLRQLCIKHSISIEETTATSEVRYKKADRMNNDLYRAEIYNGVMQKSILAWLGIRNSAAHGKYEEYTKEQVQILILGVQTFITQHPA